MTTYIFEEVSRKFTKEGKCPKCGRHYKETQKFSQTINPYNVLPDNTIKTKEDILNEIYKEADAWLATPISPHKCPKSKKDIMEGLEYLSPKELEKLKTANEEIRKLFEECEAKCKNILSELNIYNKVFKIGNRLKKITRITPAIEYSFSKDKIFIQAYSENKREHIFEDTDYNYYTPSDIQIVGAEKDE